MVKFLVGLFTGFIIGIILIISMDPAQNTLKQLQTELKFELNKAKPVKFFLKDTDIELTKLSDKTAILRIKEK